MWFWLAFGSAVLGSVDVILNKQCLNKVSAAVLTWSLCTLTLPFITYIALKDGTPHVNTLFPAAVIGSSLTFVFAKTITNETLKQNLVSKVFPLTAFSGVFTYIFGLILLSESIRPIPVAGLISVILGSYILNVDLAKEGIFKPFNILFSSKASILFLVAIMLGSLTAVFDKMGLINTAPTSPNFVLFTENALMSALLLAHIIRTEGKTWTHQVKNNFGILFLNSIIFLIVCLLVFNAYPDGPVALILGIKRLQIFFVLLLGYLFFKDKPTKHVWLATLIMILGVLMIKLG